MFLKFVKVCMNWNKRNNCNNKHGATIIIHNSGQQVIKDNDNFVQFHEPSLITVLFVIFFLFIFFTTIDILFYLM
jgi:hypothetical protein